MAKFVFKATSASLTNSIALLLRALEASENAIVAIHAIHKVNFPGIICDVGESEKLIAMAKEHLMNIVEHKAQGPSERLQSGYLVQITEEGEPVAIITTQEPVEQQFLNKYSLKLVTKSSTHNVRIEQPVEGQYSPVLIGIVNRGGFFLLNK